MKDVKTIGVALSGGGHRATVFSLGALLYLVDSGRNAKVTAVSSVSGGSIANAFIATLDKPFHEMTPDDFEPAVARFAARIAGSPSWWWITWVLYVLLLGAWAGTSFADLSNRAALTAHLVFGGGFLVWAIVIGPRSGGTLWAWCGTWLYVGVLVPLVVMALVAVFVTRSFSVALLSSIAIAVMAGLRNKVAELAFEATLDAMRETRKSPWYDGELRQLPRSIRHVFCATDMHTSRHAYFSADLLYAPSAGLAEPGKLRLSKVVQISANFPGGFPFRVLWRRRHNFIGLPILDGRRMETMSSSVVALTDGGVYDNTGSSWFLEAAERPDDAHDRDRWEREVFSKVSASERERVLKQLAAMRSVPEQILVVNASEPPRWWPTSAWLFVPFLGELLQFSAVANAFYGVRGKAQSINLHRRFLSNEYRQKAKSAMVSIAEAPASLASWLIWPGKTASEYRHMYPTDIEVAEDLKQSARVVIRASMLGPDFDESVDPLQREAVETEEELREAKAVLSRLDPADDSRPERESGVRRLEANLTLIKLRADNALLGAGLHRLTSLQREVEIARVSRFTGTTLRPLGQDLTARLLWHGYYQTMMNGAVMLEFPILKPFAPEDRDFSSLAQGRIRGRRPSVAA